MDQDSAPQLIHNTQIRIAAWTVTTLQIALQLGLHLATPGCSFAQVAGTSAPPTPDTSAAAREPFAFADFTWLNGTTRQKSSLLETKYFTGEFRLDASYIYSFNHPQDHTLIGSSESGRTMEFQVQQLGVGGHRTSASRRRGSIARCSSSSDGPRSEH